MQDRALFLGPVPLGCKSSPGETDDFSKPAGLLRATLRAWFLPLVPTPVPSFSTARLKLSSRPATTNSCAAPDCSYRLLSGIRDDPLAGAGPDADVLTPELRSRRRRRRCGRLRESRSASGSRPPPARS